MSVHCGPSDGLGALHGRCLCYITPADRKVPPWRREGPSKRQRDPSRAPLGGLRCTRLLSNLSTVSFTSLLSLQPPAGAGAGRLASPALPTPTTRASARRPRRLRRARGARRSSGACSAGCAAQPDSLRAPLIRRGAVVGAATAHAALCASHRVLAASSTPLAARRWRCPAPPATEQTNTHTLLIIG